MLDTPHPPTATLALLDACTQAIRTQRAAHAEVLSAVAALERADVHASCGHPSVARLLEELLRVDRGTARTLVTQSRLLVAPQPDSLHPDADVREPDLPATADAAHEGAVDPDHVTVIAATMTRLRAVGGDLDSPEPGAPLPGPMLAEVERQLAALARERSPRQLGEVAAEVADYYDPDGAAPPRHRPAHRGTAPQHRPQRGVHRPVPLHRSRHRPGPDRRDHRPHPTTGPRRPGDTAPPRPRTDRASR